MTAFPECITATRIGVYPETDYDEFGEQAPITWICDCGARLKLAHYFVEESPIFGRTIGGEWFPDILDEGYREVAQERKDKFLLEHAKCPLADWKVA